MVDGGLEYILTLFLGSLYVPQFPHEETHRDTMALSTLA